MAQNLLGHNHSLFHFPADLDRPDPAPLGVSPPQKLNPNQLAAHHRAPAADPPNQKHSRQSPNLKPHHKKHQLPKQHRIPPKKVPNSQKTAQNRARMPANSYPNRYPLDNSPMPPINNGFRTPK